MIHKIIIDTDPGIDDAHAIALAIAHPQIELLGLTSVFGNAAIDITTSNALALLDLFGRPDLPVARGAADPIQQERMRPADFVHGANGLGNIAVPPSKRAVEQMPAAEFIVRHANENLGELTVVAVGPLTNIAQALVLDPALPNKLKELIVMGGTVNEPGNVTPLAESNFINDPHAADKVLAHDWPISIVGLDVTHQLLLFERDFAELRDRAGSTGEFIWQITQFYLDYYASRRSRKGADMHDVGSQGDGSQGEGLAERRCAMHDASAIVYITDRDAFGLVSGPARVIHEGMGIGQLSLDINRRADSHVLPYWQNRPISHAAVEVDSKHVKAVFLDTLIKHSLC